MTLKDGRFAPPKPESGSSNVPLLLIASAFLCVTIVLALLQPGLNRSEPTAVASVEPTLELSESQDTTTAQHSEKVASLPDAQEEPLPRDSVTRTQTPLLSQINSTPDAKQYRTLSAMITDKLRQPVRLTATDAPTKDLSHLVRQTLASFTTNAQSELHPDLVSMLVESVQQKQSDAYIRVLINTATERGRFDIPQALETADGSFDTQVFLTAMAINSGGSPKIEILPVALSGTYTVQNSDSLAGIAMKHSGQPMGYLSVMQQNTALDPRNPKLSIGQILQIAGN